jgi:hypothetical protein
MVPDGKDLLTEEEVNYNVPRWDEGGGGRVGAGEDADGGGTMVVLSGPDYFVKKAKTYLQARGYPSDVVCVLPV